MASENPPRTSGARANNGNAADCSLKIVGEIIDLTGDDEVQPCISTGKTNPIRATAVHEVVASSHSQFQSASSTTAANEVVAGPADMNSINEVTLSTAARNNYQSQPASVAKLPGTVVLNSHASGEMTEEKQKPASPVQLNNRLPRSNEPSIAPQNEEDLVSKKKVTMPTNVLKFVRPFYLSSFLLLLLCQFVWVCNQSYIYLCRSCHQRAMTRISRMLRRRLSQLKTVLVTSSTATGTMKKATKRRVVKQKKGWLLKHHHNSGYHQ